jgi:prophage tail gpP-like protein
MVYFESKRLDLAQEFLIGDIEYKISSNEGRTTTMTLQKPDAFIPKPKIEKKGKAKGGGDPMDIYGD